MSRSRTDAVPPPDAQPTVVFVREWEQQMSSSGCCGRVEGDFLDFGSGRAGDSSTGGEVARPTGGRDGGGHRPDAETRVFSERRAQMEEVGVLYRAIRERFGDAVEIRIVDPRNLLSLVPIVLAEGRRHGRSLGERLRALFRLSVNMVVVNGRVVARNEWPDPAELLELLEGASGSGAGQPVEPVEPVEA